MLRKKSKFWNQFLQNFKFRFKRFDSLTYSFYIRFYNDFKWNRILALQIPIPLQIPIIDEYGVYNYKIEV